jgi:hypothetical protein
MLRTGPNQVVHARTLHCGDLLIMHQRYLA